MMDTKGFLNFVVSALASGVAAFIGYFAAGGELNKAGITAAAAAAVAAAIAHVRKPPAGG